MDKRSWAVYTPNFKKSNFTTLKGLLTAWYKKMLAFMFRIRDVVTLINRCGITTQRPRASCCLLGLTFSNWNHWTGFLQYFCLIKNVFRQTEMADISTFKKINKNLYKYSNIIQLNGLGNVTHMYLLMKWSTGLYHRENGLCFMKGKDLPLSHNSQWHIQIFMKTNDHHDSRVMQTM